MAIRDGVCRICGREFSYEVGGGKGNAKRVLCNRRACKKRNHANNALRSHNNKVIKKLREESDKGNTRRNFIRAWSGLS